MGKTVPAGKVWQKVKSRYQDECGERNTVEDPKG